MKSKRAALELFEQRVLKDLRFSDLPNVEDLLSVKIRNKPVPVEGTRENLHLDLYFKAVVGGELEIEEVRCLVSLDESTNMYIRTGGYSVIERPDPVPSPAILGTKEGWLSHLCRVLRGK